MTGKRWSLTATSYGELAELVRAAKNIAHDLRVGALSREQAIAKCEVLEGSRDARARGLLTFGEAWDEYVTTISNVSTRQKAKSVYRCHLAELAGELVVSFHDARLEQLVAKWQTAELSPSMIAKSIWAFLSAAICHAKKARKIERLPWDDFSPPPARVKKRRAAARSVDELVAVALEARKEDERDRKKREGTRLCPLVDLERRVIVLGLGGLRNGEGAGLGWDHVDFVADTITIAFQAIDQWRTHFPGKTRPDFPVKNPKSRGPLVQRMHPNVRSALLEQKVALERLGWYRPDGPVFPTRGGAWRPNANCIYPEDLRRVAIASGIANANAWVTHSLRHSFATLELAHGGDPRAVQERSGHASLRALEPYIHGTEGAPSAIRPLHELDAGKPNDTNPPP